MFRKCLTFVVVVIALKAFGISNALAQKSPLVASFTDKVAPLTEDVVTLMKARDFRSEASPERYDQAVLAIMVDWMSGDIDQWNNAQTGKQYILNGERGKKPEDRIEHRFYDVFVEDLIERGGDVSKFAELALGTTRDYTFMEPLFPESPGPKVLNHVSVYFFNPTKLGSREASFYLVGKIALGKAFIDCLIKAADGPVFGMQAFASTIDPLNRKLNASRILERWRFINFEGSFDKGRSNDAVPDDAKTMLVWDGTLNAYGPRNYTVKTPVRTTFHTNQWTSPSTERVGYRFLRRIWNLGDVYGRGKYFLVTKENIDLNSIDFTLEELEKIAVAQKGGDVRAVIFLANPRMRKAGPNKTLSLFADVDKILLTNLNTEEVVVRVDKERLATK